MSTIDTLANEAFAKLGLTGVDADLTVADSEQMDEVDSTVIVLGELSVSELKLFGAMRRAIEGLAGLEKKAMASMLRHLADRMHEGEVVDVPGVGRGLTVDKAAVIASLPDSIQHEFCRLSCEKDSAHATLFLSIRQRLNYWEFALEIRRGGNVCIPRNPEKN